ncbi:MAG: hypothetical protein ACPKM0_08345 [Pleomorphochaeta sp.]
MKTNKNITNILSIIAHDFSLFNITKIILIVVSFSSLILTSPYIQALLRLENAICGFIMFMFVLMSVVALFQTIRMHNDKVISQISNLIIVIITVIIGYQLLKIYNDAFIVQNKINNPEVVIHAITLLRNQLIIYLVGTITLIVQIIKTLR